MKICRDRIKTDTAAPKPDVPMRTVALVWTYRIVIGAVFVMSGLVKSIDLWGFIYKIEEYLDVWGFPSWRSLSFVAALFISGFEFVAGVMLLTGSFRKSVVWWLLLMMAFMLPLTLYIWISDPVSDCGCFGDFWVISNSATFFKNVLITAGLIYLAKNNRRVAYIYNPYIQWIPMALCGAYIVLIGLIGYNIQPLVDFRSFPIGKTLLGDAESDEDNDDENVGFRYVKDGREKVFTIDNLPDSTWEFVDQEYASSGRQPTDFVVIADGEDIAQSLVSDNGEQLILLIPEISRADISYALLLNELNEGIESRGGSMFALVSNGEAGVERWVDYSMASYAVYPAEPTMIKEMARGNMALIGLSGGKIQWKRTVSSLSLDDTTGHADFSGVIGAMIMHGNGVLVAMSVVLCVLLLLIAFPGLLARMVRAIKNRVRSA